MMPRIDSIDTFQLPFLLPTSQFKDSTNPLTTRTTLALILKLSESDDSSHPSHDPDCPEISVTLAPVTWNFGVIKCPSVEVLKKENKLQLYFINWVGVDEESVNSTVGPSNDSEAIYGLELSSYD